MHWTLPELWSIPKSYYSSLIRQIEDDARRAQQ